MHSALLPNGKMINARDYDSKLHGTRIVCMDPTCRAPVIFVQKSNDVSPYFKTTGKHESKHAETCGFYKTLSFTETIDKISEYQDAFLNEGLAENIVRLNLNRLDPDYESRTAERDQSKEKDSSEIKIKDKNETPKSISSLKTLVRVLTSNEPDVLSSIIVQVRGMKIPISSLVVNQARAHEVCWNDTVLSQFNYFVYGEVDKILRRDKVIYINFKPVNQVLFSIVIFDKYFPHFTFKDEELLEDRKSVV